MRENQETSSRAALLRTNNTNETSWANREVDYLCPKTQSLERKIFDALFTMKEGNINTLQKRAKTERAVWLLGWIQDFRQRLGRKMHTLDNRLAFLEGVGS